LSPARDGGLEKTTDRRDVSPSPKRTIDRRFVFEPISREVAMVKLIDIAPEVALGCVAVGLVGYILALGLATFYMEKERPLGARLACWFTAHPAQNIGIPCAAIAAFAIVSVLLKTFPSPSDARMTNSKSKCSVWSSLARRGLPSSGCYASLDLLPR
jgi:hypothetical protein